MVVHAFKPEELEVGRSEVQSHLQLHKELEPSLGHTEPNPDTLLHPATKKGRFP